MLNEYTTIMKRILITKILIFVVLQSSAAILNVPSTFSSIQAALNAANANDTVLVQPGTYMENLVWPNTPNIKLFSAGDTTNTIVDGGGIARCLTLLGATINNSTIVRGFRFTNGVSTDWSGGTGAGIKIDNGASPMIDACMVDNCSGNGSRCYGAGVSIDGGTTSITNSSIINNQAVSSGGNYDYGGGIYVTGSANINISNSDISFNNIPIGTSRAYGGGIYATGSSVNVIDCKINSNDIQGSNYSYGGGIYITAQSSLSMRGGIINSNKLSNTSRTYGGGVYITNSDASFYQVEITNQDMTTSAFSQGNGICVLSGSSLYMENCLVTDNMISGTSSNYTGGGIASVDSYVELNFCTIANNNKVGGSGLNGSGVSFGGSSDTLRINSSIIYNPNPSSEINFSGSLAEINYSDIRGGYSGTGNINTLPLFVSASNYHLQNTSPCLEVADPTSLIMIDIDGNIRPSAGSTVADMGCYEETTLTTDVSDNMFLDNISIYPNPALEIVKIKGVETLYDINKIEVFSLTGEEVISLKSYNKGINVSSLETGIYILNIYHQKGKESFKFVK